MIAGIRASRFSSFCLFLFFFFNDTATTEIYTLSLHDALPISHGPGCPSSGSIAWRLPWRGRSEEHTSELQSLRHLVCRLLLEKKKKQKQMVLGKSRPNTKHTHRAQHIRC